MLGCVRSLRTIDDAAQHEHGHGVWRPTPDGFDRIVDAEQHTGYGANDCVTTAVDAYLVSLVVPADETTCR